MCWNWESVYQVFRINLFFFSFLAGRSIIGIFTFTIQVSEIIENFSLYQYLDILGNYFSHCSLLCRTIYFHYSLYYSDFFFFFTFVCIYGICISPKKQASYKQAWKLRKPTSINSFVSKKPLSQFLINPKKILPCIRKNHPCIWKIILVLFWIIWMRSVF